jgi:hypothetical protein
MCVCARSCPVCLWAHKHANLYVGCRVMRFVMYIVEFAKSRYQNIKIQMSCKVVHDDDLART